MLIYVIQALLRDTVGEEGYMHMAINLMPVFVSLTLLKKTRSSGHFNSVFLVNY
jgi:membrane protease subunit (stomatin/prohibitin family)